MARRKFLIKDTEKFEVDDSNGQLYFDGKALKTEIRLGRWESIVAFVVAAVTIVSMAVSALNDGQQFMASLAKKPPEASPKLTVESCTQIVVQAKSGTLSPILATPCTTQTVPK